MMAKHSSRVGSSWSNAWSVGLAVVKVVLLVDMMVILDTMGMTKLVPAGNVRRHCKEVKSYLKLYTIPMKRKVG